MLKNSTLAGRNIVIATKHGKEKVIAPILEKELGLKCILAPNLDTDKFGTFTGEIERINDPIVAARNKCLLAMEYTSCDLAIASEGSFGPHPTLHFVPADDEILLFIDKKYNLEIFSRELSFETNFSGMTIENIIQLKEFAKTTKFPSHYIIAKKTKDDFTEIKKGINSWEKLYEAYSYFIKTHSNFYLETDMRAMYNPSRMKVIERASQKLAEKINSFCPKCKTRGFGVVDANEGLPCNLCGLPTRSTLSYIYKCQKCLFYKEEKYPKNKFTEDPMYCDFCNP